MKMNRVVKIIIYAVVLFLLYLWISSMAKSCNKPATTEDLAGDQMNQGQNADEEIYDEYFESDENKKSESNKESEVDEGNSLTNDLKQTQEAPPKKSELATYNENFSYEATEKEKEATKQKAVSKPSTNTNTQNTISGSTTGKYIVVAGSYLIKENAQKMVDKLKKLGYNGAEIVSFDLSQYHSISAGKYDSYDAAVSAAREIKNKGIDCYVHTKK